jgi:hypothetical protein
MDDFLQKPVMLAPLQETLKKWLKDLAADSSKFGTKGAERKREATFAETDKKLDSMQNRIDELRKRFGLES